MPDTEAGGIVAVVNGLALCAMHHLAFDRNLLGIDPEGVVHIAGRLLREIDGPMRRTGLQGFHGRGIALPRRPADRPDRNGSRSGFGASRARRRKSLHQMPTCGRMNVIRVSNVPDELHRSLKERAAREGTTMSDLILAELPRLAHKSSPGQLLHRVRRRTPVGGKPAAELIATERAER